MEKFSDYQKLYNLELAYLKQYERENGQALENAADTIAKLECYQNQVIECVHEIAKELGLPVNDLGHPTKRDLTSMELLKMIAVVVKELRKDDDYRFGFDEGAHLAEHQYAKEQMDA